MKSYPRITGAPLRLRMWQRAMGVIAVILGGLIGAIEVCGQTPQYMVTELSSDDATRVPCKLNNHGDIAGRADSAFQREPRATLWNRSNLRSKHLRAFVGGDYSSAFDINDAGEIVGVSNTGSAMVPIIWNAGGGLSRIPLLPGDWASEATAINNKGEVVGYSKGPVGMRAFFWSSSGGMQQLGILPGGNSSRAMDINDRGEAVGSSTSGSGEHAFIWTKQTGIADLNSADSASFD